MLSIIMIPVFSWLDAVSEIKKTFATYVETPTCENDKSLRYVDVTGSISHFQQ